jgi:hypothetical protein
MNPTTYRQELAESAAALRPFAETVDVRGEEAAAFVFATRERRAIELSPADGGVWVEFWDADAAVREETLDSARLAVEAAAQWLGGEG